MPHPASRSPLLALSAALLLSSLARAEAPERSFLIHDVRLFDGAALREHQDLLVRDGLIAAITDTGPAPAGVPVEEGAGRTLLPGLVDCHVHVTFSGAPPWALGAPDPEHNLTAHLRSGTTTVFDMAAKTPKIAKIAREVSTGKKNGPRIFFAGSAMTTPGGYPYAYLSRVIPSALARLFLRDPVHLLSVAADAERDAAQIAAAGGSFLKLFIAETPAGIPVLSPELVRSAVDAAHARGLRVAAHIDTAAHAMLAARAGVDLLVHGVHTDVLSAEQAAELARLGVAVVPTLITFERLHQMLESEPTFNAVERATEDPALLGEFQREKAARFELDPSLSAWLNTMSENTPARLHGNMQRLHEAGVKVFVGTDANGSIASFPGAIHDELALLVDAGYTPLEALQSATGSPAEWLGSQDFGQLRVGAPADLLLVEGDPTQNIRDSERVVWVSRGGERWFEPLR